MKQAKRLIGCGAFFGLVLIAAQLPAVTKTEKFDDPPADWTELNTTVPDITDFGYSATNLAGGSSSGEAGGSFSRNDSTVAYYADTNLGGTFSDNDSISAEGRFYRDNTNVDGGILIGFFDSTSGVQADFLGLRLIDGGRATALAVFQPGGTLGDLERGSSMNLSNDASYAFDFSYDGLTRELVVNVEDNSGVTFNSSLVVDSGDSITNLDAFGIRLDNNVGSTVLGLGFEGFIDDVTYTVVPEPNTLLLLVASLLVLGHARRVG